MYHPIIPWIVNNFIFYYSRVSDAFNKANPSSSDFAEVMYKTTNFYHPDSERSILWNDPNLLINWPNHSDILLSAKDKKATSFLAADCFIDL